MNYGSVSTSRPLWLHGHMTPFILAIIDYRFLVLPVRHVDRPYAKPIDQEWLFNDTEMLENLLHARSRVC